MTRDEFLSASIALLRSAVGWQSAIARRLGVESRTVRRWLQAGEIPPWVESRFGELMGGTAPGPWPRDEWVIGTDPEGRRRYIVHVAPPRFVARLVECRADGTPHDEEQPADVASGMVYVADGMEPDATLVLAEIDWIDAVSPGEATQWLEAAADAAEAWEDREG